MTDISDPTTTSAPSTFPNKWAILIVAVIVVLCAVGCVVMSLQATR